MSMEHGVLLLSAILAHRHAAVRHIAAADDLSGDDFLLIFALY
jgi:hypothetical protein